MERYQHMVAGAISTAPESEQTNKKSSQHVWQSKHPIHFASTHTHLLCAVFTASCCRHSRRRAGGCSSGKHASGPADSGNAPPEASSSVTPYMRAHGLSLDLKTHGRHGLWRCSSGLATLMHLWSRCSSRQGQEARQAQL